MLSFPSPTVDLGMYLVGSVLCAIEQVVHRKVSWVFLSLHGPPALLKELYHTMGLPTVNCAALGHQNDMIKHRVDLTTRLMQGTNGNHVLVFAHLLDYSDDMQGVGCVQT